jgi:hypothetical protein
MNILIVRWFVTIASAASILFGIWHIFVPRMWNWYSYMDKSATELVLAVRAVNLFFSLSLILFGLINILIIFGETKSSYSLMVVLGASSLLWFVRVVMQIIYPQGTINPILRYGMLSGFVVVFILYVVSTAIVIKQNIN